MNLELAVAGPTTIATLLKTEKKGLSLTMCLDKVNALTASDIGKNALMKCS